MRACQLCSRFILLKMLKLNNAAENKFAIYLNHRDLIGTIYKSDLLHDTPAYILKSALFNFQPKATPEPTGTNEVTPVTNSRKTKRKHVDDEPSAAKDMENLEKYLELLHASVQFQLTASADVTRIWERTYNVPQLNGTNFTKKFQEFHTADDVTYLIPHASRFYNYDIQRLTELVPELTQYDVIVIDPPWRNKYIRRLKRVRQELAYAMLYNEQLTKLPVAQLIHERTLVAIWCTNSAQHQQALREQFLPNWNLRLLHEIRWYKLNTTGKPVCNVSDGCGSQKQPYEMLYIACHMAAMPGYANDICKVEMLLSVPSIVHSHKPPLLTWLLAYVEQQQASDVPPKCLELFARYLQPQCTSIGLEVLKLMDKRLYDLNATK